MCPLLLWTRGLWSVLNKISCTHFQANATHRSCAGAACFAVCCTHCVSGPRMQLSVEASVNLSVVMAVCTIIVGRVCPVLPLPCMCNFRGASEIHPCGFLTVSFPSNYQNSHGMHESLEIQVCIGCSFCRMHLEISLWLMFSLLQHTKSEWWIIVWFGIGMFHCIDVMNIF